MPSTATLIGDFLEHIPSRLEVGHDALMASRIPDTEPGLVSIFVFIVLEGGVCDSKGVIGAPNGHFDNLLLVVPADHVQFRSLFRSYPFVVDAPGDSRVTRELDIGNPVNSGMQVLWDAISVDVGKQVRRFDRVVSRAGLSETVRGGDWNPFCEVMPGESKMTIAYGHG